MQTNNLIRAAVRSIETAFEENTDKSELRIKLCLALIITIADPLTAVYAEHAFQYFKAALQTDPGEHPMLWCMRMRKTLRFVNEIALRVKPVTAKSGNRHSRGVHVS